ncbi:MAG: mechanosensitive ion channel [Sphingomonadales bacterium]|nr:mechanosensitive ion channel [Sphingomonadales bacterium]
MAKQLPSDPDIMMLWTSAVDWIADHTRLIVTASLFGVLIVLALYGLRLVGKRLSREPNPWRSVIGRALASMKLWFMVPLAAELIATFAHAPEDVANIVSFGFVITATFQSALFLRELILGTVEVRAAGKEPHSGLANALGLVRLFVNVALFVLAALLILANLGVNVIGLVAGLGIGGIAIGLAAQGIFRDLFAALSILFDGPFRVGETIRFGDATGRVEAIGLKTTRIRSIDGDQIIMSNDKLLDLQIRNLNGIAERLVILNLPLHYANDADAIASLPEKLKLVVEGVKYCRFDHAVLTDFAHSAITLELMFHVTRGAAEARNEARHTVMLSVMRCLKEAGVAFYAPESDTV